MTFLVRFQGRNGQCRPIPWHRRPLAAVCPHRACGGSFCPCPHVGMTSCLSSLPHGAALRFEAPWGRPNKPERNLIHAQSRHHAMRRRRSQARDQAVPRPSFSHRGQRYRVRFQCLHSHDPGRRRNSKQHNRGAGRRARIADSRPRSAPCSQRFRPWSRRTGAPPSHYQAHARDSEPAGSAAR